MSLAGVLDRGGMLARVLAVAVVCVAATLAGAGVARAGTGTVRPVPGVIAPWVTPTLADPSWSGRPSASTASTSPGFIQDAMVSKDNSACPTPATRTASAGAVTLNGIPIQVPCNMVIQMPASTLTWAEFVRGGPGRRYRRRGPPVDVLPLDGDPGGRQRRGPGPSRRPHVRLAAVRERRASARSPRSTTTRATSSSTRATRRTRPSSRSTIPRAASAAPRAPTSASASTTPTRRSTPARAIRCACRAGTRPARRATIRCARSRTARRRVGTAARRLPQLHRRRRRAAGQR